jgi:chemotaxis signal transduction protein
VSDTASDLRRQFDGSFATARDTPSAEVLDLLGISVRGDPHAILLSAITSVFADQAITALPGRAPALLGITGMRGAIVPVFDLGAILGYPPASSPRWLAIAERAGKPVALAFDAFLGQLRVAPSAFAPRAANHVTSVVQARDGVWPVIEIGSVLAGIDRERERER